MFIVINKSRFLKRYFFERNEIERILILSSLFSISLVSARFLYTDELIFLFLPWNLFLAWLPYALTGWLEKHPQWIESRLRFFIAFSFWILFIPNSFYIITDLFHLG
ncbi:MAG: DUF1361 domain-containing protein, partial [Bacteroidia bacterium]|nr:DUF1361 domain-containing protein [Bacteroidia bacterium]